MIGSFVGIILGIIFFGGLYLTIGKLKDAKNPGILFVLSFLLRMAILLGGLYLISKYGFMEMVLALLGIITVKLLMIIWAKRPLGKSTNMKGSD